MEKYKYVTEFEIKASPKMIFPYLASASGLETWFADHVSVSKDQLYDIIWDEESHPAKIISKRTNHHVRFQFLEDSEEATNLSYLDFKIEYNEITQTTFLKITDYSDMDEQEDLDDMWNQLINQLRATIGT